MNTANLQLEGLYAAFAAVLAALQRKGILSEQEIENALRDAEHLTAVDAQERGVLSPAEVEGVCFPIRLLMEANRATARQENLSFSKLARMVGESKSSRMRAAERTSAEAYSLADQIERERDA